jgi:hypothetical protein
MALASGGYVGPSGTQIPQMTWGLSWLNGNSTDTFLALHSRKISVKFPFNQESPKGSVQSVFAKLEAA